MVDHRKVSFFNFYHFSLCTGLLLLLFSSCVTVSKKQYQKDKPFVVKTNISVSGNIKPAEKAELISKLQNQLDDSLKVRIISYAEVVKTLIKPPGFDTVNIERSRFFMTDLLNSLGYFYPTITDTFKIGTKRRHLKKHQYRVTINFQVKLGIQTKLDSVGYDLLTPELQELALRTKGRSIIKKGDPYSLQLISDERDRLLQVFHNNGYYKVTGDDIFVERDTVIAALIDPTLDPFEQIASLDSLRRKKDKPTITLVFKQRDAEDTTHLKRFHIGTVKVYPDQYFIQDSSAVNPDDSATVPGYKFKFFSTSNRFKLPYLARNIFLFPDSLYRERNYFRTINTFNRLGAWQSVDVTLKERYDTIPTLDAEIRLYPSKKFNLKVDLEVSRNIADYLTTTQLFGLGVNFALTNRNAFRQAIQTSTNARFGIELGSNFIQTLQTNLSHSIFFPHHIKPSWIKFKNESDWINQRTVVNINGSYTIRRDIYNVGSINTSWGYEWSKRKKRNSLISWQVTALNLEFTRLHGKDSLDQLMKDIPSLKYAFNDGFVSGQIGALNTSWNKKNRFSSFRIRVEQSGAVLGLIKSVDEDNLFRFIKTDIELKNFINYKYSGWAFRGFAGYGYVYGKKDGQPEYKLPFFKAYFAGGPYSMRAWRVRQLGPGSAIIYDTTNNESNDRFGNMQLEGNVEYRFNLTTVAGIKVKSALFVDVGNIWGIEFVDAAATEEIPEASFKFSRLYKDIAVGGGLSLRFDFDFFLIRLDWAYKLKNPRWADINNGWFYDLGLFNGQFQLGIGYPF